MRDGTSGFASSKGAPASDARDTSLFTDLHRAPSGITSPTPRTQASHALFHDREVGMVEGGNGKDDRSRCGGGGRGGGPRFSSTSTAAWANAGSLSFSSVRESENRMHPNAHTYVTGTDVETHGHAVTQNICLKPFFWTVLCMFPPVTIPVHRRLWNMEEGRVLSLERGV